MSSSKSKSSSSSNTTTNTENTDARVGAEGEAIAVGGEGTLNISNIDEFPEEVGEFANKILDVLVTVTETTASSANKASDAAISSVEGIAARSQSSGLLLQDLTDNIVPIVAIAAAGVVGYAYFKRKGR